MPIRRQPEASAAAGDGSAETILWEEGANQKGNREFRLRRSTSPGQCGSIHHTPDSEDRAMSASPSTEPDIDYDALVTEDRFVDSTHWGSGRSGW
jgi:hypothetical protein